MDAFEFRKGQHHSFKTKCREAKNAGVFRKNCAQEGPSPRTQESRPTAKLAKATGGVEPFG